MRRSLRDHLAVGRLRAYADVPCLHRLAGERRDAYSAVWRTRCADPDVRLESTAPNTTGWFSVGEHRDGCSQVQYTEQWAFAWKNLRMRPGDKHSFTGRFMVRLDGAWGTMNVSASPTAVLRATWRLGCTEKTEADDCLSVLETNKVPPRNICSFQCRTTYRWLRSTDYILRNTVARAAQQREL